jgi:lipopolysaccharide biosynthesis glycosyltransferase
VKTIIISGSDAEFWPLLSGMLHSIDLSIRREGISIGILDLGLKSEQLDRLRTYGATIVAPDWDYPVAHFRARPPATLKALWARPHLQRYFPGYDLYIWLDADCWVQDWQSVALIASSAQEWLFAIVPEIDRSYSGFFPGGASVLAFISFCYKTCYGEQYDTTLLHYPLLNGGVWGATRGAPHWAEWDKQIANILSRHSDAFFYAEQTALNYAIRHHKLRTAFLPARCNWMCNRAIPCLALDGKTLVEPMPPHVLLGVLHLTGEIKKGIWPVQDLAGRTHSMALTHPMLPI